MGKSDKKVKSDRINALKKQYDAFLEDDKKRKERNEYILEKLDKMRYCTAMVQVRQKAPVFIDSRKVSLYNTPEKALESPRGLSHISSDSPRQRLDETVLLQEISKKYILIPKLRPAYDGDYTHKIAPKIDDNIDWKSKYDILEKLKRDEKEQDSSMREEANLVEQNQNTLSKMYYKEGDITQDNEPLLEYRNELPVKLPPEDQLSYELQHYDTDNTVIDPNYLYDSPINNANEKTNQNILAGDIYCENNSANIDYDKNSVLNTAYDDSDSQNMGYDQNNIHNNITYHQTQLENTIYDQVPSKDNGENIQTQEGTPNVDLQALNVEPMKESNQLFDTNQNTTVDPSGENYPQTDIQNIGDQEESIVLTRNSLVHEELAVKEEENNNIADISIDHEVLHEVNTDDTIPEINNDIPPENDAVNLGTNVEYPIESVNVQDFTPHSDVHLVEGVNVNPEPQGFVANNDLTHHYDPAVEPDNINRSEETFNTEQNEEFYTEQKENYDYTEEGITENYNMDYSQPTENYQQNQEYAYYEGTQPEQPYAGTNENEETTQQYDQNYEQQYGTEYDQQSYQHPGYEQEYAQGYDQQGYTDPQQQYETVNEPQQDLQYENQDILTPQYVEQQLDNEEGYVENVNEKTEDSNVQIPVESQQIPAVADQEAKVQ